MDENFNKHFNLVKNLKLNCSKAAARTLYFQTINTHDDVVLELGSNEGVSSIFLAAALRDKNSKSKVYCVDSWKADDLTFKNFLSNVEIFNDYVVPLIGTPDEVYNKWPVCTKIGLVHFNYSRESYNIERAFNLWSALLPVGGVVIFDSVPSNSSSTKVASHLPKNFKVIFDVMFKRSNKWVAVKTDE